MTLHVQHVFIVVAVQTKLQDIYRNMMYAAQISKNPLNSAKQASPVFKNTLEYFNKSRCRLIVEAEILEAKLLVDIISSVLHLM